MTTSPTTDEQFEDRLLRSLLEDYNELTAIAPTSGHAPASRSPRRRSVARRTAPSLALAGAAGVTVVALIVSGAVSDGHGASLPVAGGHHRQLTHPDLHTASFVLAKMTAATAAGPFVVVETGTAPDSETGRTVYTKSWFVPGGTMSRDEVDDSTGNPISATVTTSHPDGSSSVVSIDYAAKSWSEATYGPAPAGGSAPLPQTPAQNASRLRDEQASGSAALVGPATVDGQQTIELREGSVAAGEQFTWVDADTYLPVREIDTAPGGSATSDSAIQSDDLWLPASPANRQLVTAAAAIPSGFTEQQ